MDIKITNLEALYLDLIAHCEMNPTNGATPDCAGDVNTFVWAKERASDMGISEKALGGVMASLIKKGFIWVTDEGPDGSGVGFTDKGFANFALLTGIWA